MSSALRLPNRLLSQLSGKTATSAVTAQTVPLMPSSDRRLS